MGLECIQKYRDKFDFPKEIYKRHRRETDAEARDIAEDLFHNTTDAPAQERSRFFGRWRRKK